MEDQAIVSPLWERDERGLRAAEPERYDWNAYPVPWSAYAAPENWY